MFWSKMDDAIDISHVAYYVVFKNSSRFEMVQNLMLFQGEVFLPEKGVFVFFDSSATHN